MERYAMKALGEAKSYIVIDIDYSDDGKIITKYIESLTVKYNLDNTKIYDTWMETNLKLDQAREIDCSSKCKNIISELVFVSTGIRPDIAYNVNYLSHYQSCYDQTHYKYAMRILKYLNKT